MSADGGVAGARCSDARRWPLVSSPDAERNAGPVDDRAPAHLAAGTPWSSRVRCRLLDSLLVLIYVGGPRGVRWQLAGPGSTRPSRDGRPWRMARERAHGGGTGVT